MPTTPTKTMTTAMSRTVPMLRRAYDTAAIGIALYNVGGRLGGRDKLPDMGTLKGFAPPFGPPTRHRLPARFARPRHALRPPPATTSPLASLGLARWCAAGEGTRECARGGQGGLSVPKAGGLPTRLRSWCLGELPRWDARGGHAIRSPRPRKRRCAGQAIRPLPKRLNQVSEERTIRIDNRMLIRHTEFRFAHAN
jgi:hypothetical protein